MAPLAVVASQLHLHPLRFAQPVLSISRKAVDQCRGRDKKAHGYIHFAQTTCINWLKRL